MNNRILLFIPMYNCEKQIVRVLKQLDFITTPYFEEVIIVNNRSTDQSEKAVIDYCNSEIGKKELDLKVTLLRNNENYSLGGSHKVAFNYAIEHNYDHVVVLHGDDQGDLHDLVPYLKDGSYLKYDSMLGSRFEKESKLINYSDFRIFGNRVFNLFMSVMAGKKITDLGSGLNMYNTGYLKKSQYLYFPNNLTFNCYMLLFGIFAKSKFRFFPLSWREDDQVSNAKMFKQSVEIFKITVQFFFAKQKLFSGKDNEFSKIDYRSETIYCNETTLNKQKIHLIMPMGGGGTRFGNTGFQVPKPLIEIHGKPFFYWATRSIEKDVELEDLTCVVLKEHIEKFEIDRHIKNYFPQAKIVVIPQVLNGAVFTCEAGIQDIKDDLPIVFNDCDHMFSSKAFNDFCNSGDFSDMDGGLLTFSSDDARYSYAQINGEGIVLKTVEKEVVSDRAICGVYYFKNTSVFLEAEKGYLESCKYQEYFVSGLYNEIAGRGLKSVTFPVDFHVSFGTPDEFEDAKESDKFEELV